MSSAILKNSKLVSKRWAKALMELVIEDGNISKDEVLENLRDITGTIAGSEELYESINNPSISVEEKQIIICKLFENRVLPVVYNFIFALNLRKRLNIISPIADEFENELNRLNNIVNVDVVSAIDLTEERKEYIKLKIAEKLHKDVMVGWSVDEDIIAGLVFNIDEQVIDNSIRHKLEDLSKHIIKL